MRGYYAVMRKEIEKAASDTYNAEVIGPYTDAAVVVEEVHMAPVNLNDRKCSAGKFRMGHQHRIAERPAVATAKPARRWPCTPFRRPYIAKPPGCIYKWRVVGKQGGFA